jgi:hypothetical protein
MPKIIAKKKKKFEAFFEVQNIFDFIKTFFFPAAKVRRVD